MMNLSPDDFSAAMAVRLVLASLLGALIGLEREIHGRTAGFRTHLLVSLGSALFVAVSISFYRTFGNFGGTVPVGVDPGRVAAQVVVGIGFLGAGAIIREKASVRGLTTAACLWIASAIGVACGSGLFFLSILVTMIALISLIALKKIEEVLPRDRYASLIVQSVSGKGQFERIRSVAATCGLDISVAGMERHHDGWDHFELNVKLHGQNITQEILDTIASVDGVRSVSLRLKASA